MKFLLNVYASAATALDHERILAVAGRSGELIAGHALSDPSISTVVQVRDGVVEVNDGPYLPVAQQAAGQYLLDCESRERAVELAALVADGHGGTVEVRPVMDSAGWEM
ncbi:YciI family protein [Nonomuraea sp. PA05]|uniref:YciI family protein n=1 Tax=Nonomuraea sp. PA05 TaxID=2604466 RepID=UPI0016526F23|nr:YciI family protein [Nonomuraea sp. PA05]